MTVSNLVRYNIASNSPWEPLRGYSRAVRIGDQLWMSGTTAVNGNGEVVGVNDAYQQTKFIIDRARQILQSEGFALSDVVRTRLYITQMSSWDAYARAHREAFETIRPASSIVQVSKLVDPRLLIEMEVEAVRGCATMEEKRFEQAATPAAPSGRA